MPRSGFPPSISLRRPSRSSNSSGKISSPIAMYLIAFKSSSCGISTRRAQTSINRFLEKEAPRDKEFQGADLQVTPKAKEMPRRDAVVLESKGLEMRNQALLNRADFTDKTAGGRCGPANTVKTRLDMGTATQKGKAPLPLAESGAPHVCNPPHKYKHRSDLDRQADGHELAAAI
jgi:hypothetical protein